MTTPKILVLSPHSLGERQKIKAVADLFAAHLGAEIVNARIEMHPNRFIRSVTERLLSLSLFRAAIATSFFRQILFRYLFRVCDLQEQHNPTLIIASQGKRIVPAAMLAVIYQAKWIHIGPPKRPWRGLLTGSVALSARNRTDPSIASIEVLPTRVRLKPSAKSSSPIRIAVFLGGYSHGNNYNFSPKDWADLWEDLKHISECQVSEWLISSSPRTPVEIEKYLSRKIDECGNRFQLLDATWYNHKAQDVVAAYLAQADAAIVTEDSRSMVSDAVAAGVPTYTLRPQGASPKQEHLDFLAVLEDKRRIKRLEISDIRSQKPFELNLSAFSTLEKCWAEEVREKLLPLVQA